VTAAIARSIRPHRDPGRRPVELELRHGWARPSPTISPTPIICIWAEPRARPPFSAISTSPTSTTCRCSPGRDGELTDEWNEPSVGCRRHTHRLGVWTYKNLDTPSTGLDPAPEGWSEIVASPTQGRQPSAAVIDRAFAQYLDGIRFKNGEVAGVTWRRSGLKSAP